MSLPLPLLPSQILWLNLITDGFLDVALAMEPEHETSLLKTNHQQKPKIFDSTIIYKMFYLALPMSLIGLATFMSLYKTDIALARTLTLVTLAMFQWFNALNCRSEQKSIFQIGLFSNFWLIIATLAVFLLQLLVIYAPFMQHIFKTVPLTLHHWMYAIGVSCSVLIMEEMRKFIVHRFFIK
jgi:Ca2+-transporting ATPase